MSLILGLLLFILLLLAVPLGLEFQFSRYGTLEGHVRIRWAFGLLRFELPISGEGETQPDQLKGIDLKGGAPPIRLITRLWRALEIRDLHLYLRLGLEDPADTGRLWGLFGPLSGMLYACADAEVDLVPEFMRPCLEFEAAGEIRVVPLRIIAILIGERLSFMMRS